MAVPIGYAQNTGFLVEKNLIFRDVGSGPIDITGVTLANPDIEVIRRVGSGSFFGALVVNIQSFTSASVLDFVIYGVDLDENDVVLSQNALGSVQMGDSVITDPSDVVIGTHIFPIMLNALNGRLFNGIKFVVSGSASDLVFTAFFGKRIKS